MTTLSSAEKLRQELEATRLAYHQLLATIPQGAWERKTANPAWNVRQTMFHITLALRFLPEDVALLRRGRMVPFPMGLFNFLNKWYTRWAGSRQTRASLADAYDRHHEAVLALLETIAPEEWALAAEYPAVNENLRGRRSIEDMFHYSTVHFEEHAADVRAALARPGRQLPRGLGRWLFRAPIFLYRVGLGWLLGGRFLLLRHVGRKSGLTRRAVLEVVDYDRATDTYYVASGFGRASQWFKNLQVQPEVTIQVGTRKLAVTAEILDPERSGEMMVAYARRHPVAAENLARVLGIEVDGTEAGYRRAAEAHLPFVTFHPREVLREGPSARQVALPLALLSVALLGVLGWLRRKASKGAG